MQFIRPESLILQCRSSLEINKVSHRVAYVIHMFLSLYLKIQISFTPFTPSGTEVNEVENMIL